MIQKLRRHYARSRAEIEQEGEFPNHAAVLIAVTDSAEPDIIFTQRAEHLSSHAGEVSFPGGKWEVEDPSLVVTALRESEEEIRLPMDTVEVINTQPPRRSLMGLSVTPVVGIVPHQLSLKADPGEIAHIFRVPVTYFLADEREQTDVYYSKEFGPTGEFWSPVYRYEGFRIWGLTARMLVEFLNTAFDARLVKDNLRAPVVERQRRVQKN